MSDTKKTTLDVPAAIHRRVRAAAKKQGCSMRHIASLLLDYALAKHASGQIEIREPQAADVEG